MPSARRSPRRSTKRILSYLIHARLRSLFWCGRFGCGLLRRIIRLALALGVVGGLVVRRAVLLRDVAHHGPVLLIADRHEPVVAVELLLHFRREAEREEALLQLLRQLRLQVIGIGKRRGRKY